MNMHTPAITGEFSVSDLLREAAERSIEVSYAPVPQAELDLPSMSGTILAEETQPGLLISGFDLTYTADSNWQVEAERSVMCAVLLGGEGEPLDVRGQPPIGHETGRVTIVGFGEPVLCSRAWRTGQHARVFGVTLKPGFFDRFGTLVDDDGLATLRRFIRPGVHSSILPRSQIILDIAESCLEQYYGGPLQALFRESQTLRFTAEVARLLEEGRQLIAQIGRRPYERACEAKSILDSALVDPPKLLDLARTLGINVATLQANFKAAFGSTVFGYVRARRLEMGRILIVDHGMGVAEAGYRVGFTNAAAFTAAYRRHFGRAPSVDR